jgi:hypothetical protein
VTSNGDSTSSENKAYAVCYWDAYGNAHRSEPLTHQNALAYTVELTYRGLNGENPNAWVPLPAPKNGSTCNFVELVNALNNPLNDGE